MAAVVWAVLHLHRAADEYAARRDGGLGAETERVEGGERPAHKSIRRPDASRALSPSARASQDATSWIATVTAYRVQKDNLFFHGAAFLRNRKDSLRQLVAAATECLSDDTVLERIPDTASFVEASPVAVTTRMTSIDLLGIIAAEAEETDARLAASDALVILARRPMSSRLQGQARALALAEKYEVMGKLAGIDERTAMSVWSDMTEEEQYVTRPWKTFLQH